MASALAVSIRLADGAPARSAPLVLSLTLTNTGTEPVRVLFRPALAIFDIRVHRGGAELEKTERGLVLEEGAQMGQAALVDLEPSASLEETVDLAEIFSLETPGAYSVAATYATLGDEPGAPGHPVVSNELSFEIRG